MRQRLAIFITIAVVLALLIGLNAASYVRVERSEDTEWNPDRSTYNSGQTGTRALYELLGETGRKVMRWRESPSALLNNRQTRPSTFVVVGKTSVPFSAEQAESLLRWVSQGGRLVIIDRRPDARLLPPSGDWHVATELLQNPSPEIAPDNPEELTAGVSPAHATQPTILTRDVDSVMPSRLASLIKISSDAKEKKTKAAQGNENRTPEDGEEEQESEPVEEPPPPKPLPTTQRPTPRANPVAQPGPMLTVETGDQPPPPKKMMSKIIPSAPVIHLTNERGALLIDYPHGDGRIIVLSDPFIVANNGINRADNLMLALNLVASAGGLIAFDEYHQGHAAIQNELFAYFKGTPVMPMLGQAALIVLALLWTSGRRFARPLPVPRVDRRSKLEFVASMAELQQSARAYDLAIENIYARLRRVLARYAGVEHGSGRAKIAAGVAARSTLDREKLEALMRDCEDAINGGPINARGSLELVARLRETERALGLRMRAREIRQAKER